MLQKRDEYNLKRRKGLSAFEKERKKQEEVNKFIEQEEVNKFIKNWMCEMIRSDEEYPYSIQLENYEWGTLLKRSKFPQKYPEYDRVVADVFQEWKKKQTLRHCRMIKEELMMTCWHPDRVEKMVEQGYEFD
jgi:hypothetical protein